jgi:hypothetical protein
VTHAAELPANLFMVGNLEDTIIVSGLTPRRLTRAEALNLAAWLVARADGPDVAHRGDNAYSDFLDVLACIDGGK